jgi:hypothetical protein
VSGSEVSRPEASASTRYWWPRSFLAGAGFGELGDGLVEPAGAAEVGGQDDAVTGTGVRPVSAGDDG